MSLNVNWFQALNKWESELFQGQREILNYAYLKSKFIPARKTLPCIHYLKQIKEISHPLQAKLSHSQPIETNPNFKKAKKKRKNISIYQIIYNDIYKYTHTCMHAHMWINVPFTNTMINKFRWGANPNAFYTYVVSYSVWYVGKGYCISLVRLLVLLQRWSYNQTMD